MFMHMGQQFGNYRLIRSLGRGGFAEVYLGEHIYLQTRAAIKVMFTAVAENNIIIDLRNEAYKNAHLIHPNIVRVLEFGVEGNIPYLVMDYAPGGTLRARHPGGERLPLNVIRSYLAQVTAALQYAHQKKIIHRDIKPENMLIGEQNQILLSDFGIALIAQTSRSQNTEEFAGTVSYMSPEHIQGKPRLASDQYSLGIVVYEWLCGKRPFYGSFTELCAQQMFAEPPSLWQQVPTISPGIEQIVMRTLAKDPEQRFPDIQAFAIAFEQACQASVTSNQFVVPPEIMPSRQSEEPPTRLSSFHTHTPINPPTSTWSINIPPISATKKVEEEPPTKLISLPYTPPPVNLPISTPPVNPPLSTPPINLPISTPPVNPPLSTRNISPSQLSSTKRIEEELPTRLSPSHPNAPINPAIPPPAPQNVIAPPTNSSGKTIERPRPLARPAEPTVRGPKTQPPGSDLTSKGTAASNLPGYADTRQSLPDWPTPMPIQPISPPIAAAKPPTPPRIPRRTIVIGGLTLAMLVATGIITLTEMGPNHPLGGGPTPTTTKTPATAPATQQPEPVPPYLLYTYLGHAASISSLAWASDSKRIASASYDRTVQVWNSSNGGTPYVYRGHSDIVTGVTWSPDGKRIASASSDKTVQVWDAINGANVHTYRGHTDKVVAVEWSPNGNRIASTGYDTTVQVWDAANGATSYTRAYDYQGHSHIVYTTTWSSDGKCIAFGGDGLGDHIPVEVWQIA